MKKSKNKIKKSLQNQNLEHNNQPSFKKGQKIKNSPLKTRKWFYLVLGLIPILFFILLESALQLFNYGYDLSQWVDVGNNKLMINPNIGKRYFNNIDFLPKTSDDTFDKQKKVNAFRVFILGGSSVAGFPFMPMGSFSSYIKRRLELVYPDNIIEVVNLGMTAVNSYTILDLIPEVLDQNPDLFLLYTGHNEYYGALGVGSIESLGSSELIKNYILKLNKYKTTQLIRNVIKWSLSIFTNKTHTEVSNTLMSRMAQDKAISINSEVYYDGLDQFNNNLNKILNLVKERNIPVIIGKVVCNYRDQEPLMSGDSTDVKSAIKVYLEARNELENFNYKKADSLFILAKELDLLKFRAPESINTIITKLAKEYEYTVVPIDSIFNSLSPFGITGNNLMVDHLHPNIEGYRQIGKAFYEFMNKLNYLPQNINPRISFDKQDSVTRENLMFTPLDSIIGYNIVTLLKNDWPFSPKKSNQSNKELLKPKNYLDSISLKYIENKISFVDAYLEAATTSLRRDNIKDYLKYMNLLIYKYPGLKDINTAVKYFYEQKKVNPLDYTLKRLGMISLLKKDYDKAIDYLTESLKSNPDDINILYNLSFAYTEKKNYKDGLKFISKCLKIDPKDTNCLNLKNKIIKNQL